MTSGQLLRRWGLVALLGLTSLGSWQAAQRGDTDDARVDPVVYPRVLQTPMLSARRVPRTLQAPVVDAAMVEPLQAAIGSSPPSTCLMVEAGGRLLAPSSNVSAPLIPASNQKLLTTWAALEVLGPEFRFRTRVLADAAPAGGVVTGNLYLVGAGDPFLSTDNWWSQYESVEGRYHTRLEDLADRVVAAGVTQVTGALVGDESLFDQERQVVDWASRLVEQKQSGPLSALTVNEGFVDWPPRFTDSFSSRSPTDDPPLLAVSVLAQLLAERGVTVGSTTTGVAPPAAVEVTAIESPPLSEIVTHINSFSSNLGAEMVLKRLGVEVAGQGTTAAGAQVVTAKLAEFGIPIEGLEVRDGSGLSDKDRVSCQTLTAVLDQAGPDSPLAASLSIGGVRGSLQQRFTDTPAVDRVRAKTGTLNNALALSGFVSSATDPDMTLTFAYIANEDLIDGVATRATQDALVVALTGYPGRPALNELVPLAPIPS